MPVNTEDVQEAVAALWAAATNLVALVPGGLIEGRVADPAANPVASPYTTFKVTDGPVLLTCGSSYVQNFTVEFTTYDEAGAANLGPIKAAIEAAFWTALRAARTTVAVPSGSQVQIMAAVNKSGGIEEDPATQQGKAVKIARDVIELQCQG